MKRTACLMAAFAAGMIVNTLAARVSADTPPLPFWVTNGACYLTANSGGNETVLQVHGAWVKTEAALDGTEQWRNLAVASWLKRLPEEQCRRNR
jgi:hypothetical protein